MLHRQLRNALEEIFGTAFIELSLFYNIQKTKHIIFT